MRIGAMVRPGLWFLAPAVVVLGVFFFLPIVAALLVSSKLTRLPVLWRTIFFAPVVTTLVAVAVVWKYLYDKQYGMLNHFLEKLFGRFGFEPIDWLGDG